jgi:hypothetical protein
MLFSELKKVWNVWIEVKLYDSVTFETLYQGDLDDVNDDFDNHDVEGIYTGSEGYDGVEISLRKDSSWDLTK